ncbi:MAG: Rieske (2Fe-2S) protein [Halobacteriales archaeon]
MTGDDDRYGFRKVADSEEIPDGRGIGVEIDGIEIAVFNAGGEYFAISNRCAHQSAPLCKAGERKINAEHTWTETRGGVNVEAKTVSCPWHLWTWDLETGQNEASGSRIATFECRVEDGDVLVRI